MCSTQCVLALVALYVGLAHSFAWDFATASDGQLEFYLNGSLTRSESITTGYTWINYDAVGNRMVFINHKGSGIFSYDITTKKIKSFLVNNNFDEYITAVAFDPVEELLFWTKQEKIYWFSLKPGFANNVYGNLLNRLPKGNSNPIMALAVDSCRGYIYWTRMKGDAKNFPYTIERARFDGSESEVLIDDKFKTPRNLVIDQQTKKMYWTHDTRRSVGTYYEQFSIESADLNGQNRTILYSERGTYQPITLAVSKDYIYWAHYSSGTAYQLPKNPSIDVNPKEISTTGSFRVLVTNYKMDDQIRGIQDCEGLKRQLPTNSVTDDNVSLNVSSEVSLLCVHGVAVSGKSQCACAHGYSGERCDDSVCQNYCLQGDCSVSAEGQPTCRCKGGYSGERCEVNVCRGYCLNDGICSLDEESKPVCQCKGHYEGDRCDVSTCLSNCFQKVVSKVWGIINEDVTQASLDQGVKATCVSTAV